MAVIRVEGLRQLGRQLNKVDKEYGKELRLINLAAAELVADRTKARSSGRQGGKAAKGVKAKATQRTGKVELRSKPTPYTLSYYFGQKRRSGWYARMKYDRSRGRQFRQWVGNQWDPGETGAKPYVLGDAMNDSIDEIIDLYDERLQELMGRAFEATS